MVCVSRLNRRPHELTRATDRQVDEHEGYRWARHRPVPVVHIDLDRDSSPDIGGKFDRWEQMETGITPSPALTGFR
jgi:hypothetical protein